MARKLTVQAEVAGGSRAHLRSIFRKLTVTRRAEAIVAVLSSERSADSV